MNTAHRKGLTGWHILAMFVGFFAVVMAADLSFAVLAYRSAPGQSAKDPYEAGLLYQQHLDARAREAELGWRASVSQPDGDVALSVVDSTGAAVTGLTVTAEFNRPATQRGAIQATLIEAAPGLYRLERRDWSGAWDMRAVATERSGRKLEIESRLQWP